MCRIEPIEYNSSITEDDKETVINIDHDYFEKRGSMTSYSNIEVLTLDELINKAGGFGKYLLSILLQSIDLVC